jgi:hypothetical protein
MSSDNSKHRFDDKNAEKAKDENRLITLSEGQIRKRVGLFILCALCVSFFLFPSFRRSYGSLSVISAIGVGTWRTGNESL